MAFFNLGVYPKYFQHILLHSARPHVRRGKDLHPGDRISEGLPQGAHLCLPSMPVSSASPSTPQHPAADVRRLHQSLRHLADGRLRPHPARRPGRECPRPPSQLPHGLHEPDPPVSVLEHELPRGASHVPAGALPRAAEAARCREGRLPHALSEPLRRLARDRPDRRQAGQRSRLSRQAPASRSRKPGRKKASLASDATARRGRLDRGLRRRRSRPRRRHPLRPRQENLSPSTATQTASSTPPTASAPTATPISPTAW